MRTSSRVLLQIAAALAASTPLCVSTIAADDGDQPSAELVG